MAAASWMHHEGEQAEDRSTTLALVRDLLSRCRLLINQLKIDGPGPRNASPDKSLVFCLLLVGYLDAFVLFWALKYPRSLSVMPQIAFPHVHLVYRARDNQDDADGKQASCPSRQDNVLPGNIESIDRQV